MSSESSIHTRLQHLGMAPCDAQHPVAPVGLPAVRTSTVKFNTVEDLEDTYKRKSRGERLVTYGRMGMETHAALEDIFCALEGGRRAFLASSGLGAISMTLLSLLSAGDHLLAADCVYGPVGHLADTVLRRLDIDATFTSAKDPQALEQHLKPNTKILYVEAPGSLLMQMLDMPALAEFARRHELILVTDNTWGSGYAYRPLALGADVSIVAGTKYVAGHSDLMLGAVIAKDPALIKTIDTNQYAMGFSISADDAWLAIRGVRTLPVRMEQHARNALAVCQWLARQAAVKKIFHPAWRDDAGHQLWKRDCTGSNGLLSVALDMSKEQVRTFVNALELFGIGYSWGGYESLVQWVDSGSLRSHAYFDAHARENVQVVRLHIGLESVDDIIADLHQALQKAGALS
ncbi:cystathionine beta-lyase [Advenella sp. S44]|uniref:trans-sulfuration enzyme family protein n=1 Tax=Advenella sp. S44 TaxID=1982755 RepID=UPI000C2A30AF|nr:aminotransferase class I/II-fold pyridoxal phosphate-dependent enzyme [Advenella sp. S44]PJX28294.1 cystathionine beta-lyase [Advenella sp. S44]